jgi:hypothetical protein
MQLTVTVLQFIHKKLKNVWQIADGDCCTNIVETEGNLTYDIAKTNCNSIVDPALPIVLYADDQSI